MRRTGPTWAATAISAGPSSVVSGVKLEGSTTARYSGSTPFMAARAASRRRAASRSPDAKASRAANRPRDSPSARSRSCGASRRLREDRASPSGSRTVGRTSIRDGMSRSETIRVTTATCWASFWPKKATSGCTMFSSLATTVQTPAKCPGPRSAPS